MNRDRFEGNWKQLGGHVKEQWGRFTRDLRCESAGNCALRDGVIQEQYGISKEKAARQLKVFRERNHHWDVLNRETGNSQKVSKLSR